MLVAVVVVEGLASLTSFLLLGELKFFQLCLTLFFLSISRYHLKIIYLFNKT